MTLDVRVNGYSLRDILAGPPKISDQMNAVCRTLEIKIQEGVSIGDVLGKPIELWYGGTRWYYGWVQRRSIDAKGNTAYIAYDGLFFFKRHKDDFYYKNMTATQWIKSLASRAEVKVSKLANTTAVFKALYYPASEADKVAVDVLARTTKANGKKYWLRYDPVAPGILLYERTAPKEMWSFLSGVNLTDATYEESIEDMYNSVKLVNRETGKVVVKTNPTHIKAYGTRRHFEEVDKEAVKIMDKTADQRLAELSKVAVSMNISGINPDRTMAQLFSGDAIYVEERVSKIVGGYYITDIAQSFESDTLVKIGASVTYNASVPAIQYENATEKPDFLKTEAEKKAEDAAKNKKK